MHPNPAQGAQAQHIRQRAQGAGARPALPGRARLLPGGAPRVHRRLRARRGRRLMANRGGARRLRRRRRRAPPSFCFVTIAFLSLMVYCSPQPADGSAQPAGRIPGINYRVSGPSIFLV